MATTATANADPATEGPIPVVLHPGQRVDVVVRDIEMSFGSMVVFIIKWTLASIPALLILLALGLGLSMLFAGVFAGLVGSGIGS